MRIAHVSDCFLPRLGGIEMQVNDLTRRQVAAGHHPEVITATPAGPSGAAGADPRVRIHRSGLPIPAEIANNPLPSRPIRRVLQAGAFDAVHVHAGVGSPFAAAGLRVALELGLPTVVTVHCLRPPFRLPLVLTPWLDRELAPRFALTAVSEAAAVPLRERTGVDVTVLPNGLNPWEWRVPADPEPASGTPEDQDGPRVVRAVATMRLSVRKRPLPLLSILRSARERLAADGSDVDLRLTVFGDGKLRPRMERYLRRHGLAGAVRLAGRIDRASLLTEYAAADLFLAPAFLESFGIAALEARCAGLPVVAMRDTGVTEFVADGREGLIADGDRGMVDALVRLAADGPLRRRLAEHNRRTEPPTAWSTVLARLDGEYTRAARLAGQAGPLSSRRSAR